MKRLKVLVSAYACRPGEGSEPGVGWNVVRELVEYHDIWVLTRSDNRVSIESELTQHPLPELHFIPHSASPRDQKIIKTKPLDRSDYIFNKIRLLRICFR